MGAPEYIQFIVTLVQESQRALQLQIGDDIRSRYWVPKKVIRDEKGKELDRDNLCLGIVVKVRIAAWFAKRSGIM